MSSSESDGEHIRVEDLGAVRRVTMARPEKRNALTVAMYRDLARAVLEAEARPSVRVVLLTGAGGCFTAGNDLMDFMAGPPRDESAPVFGFLRALSQASKPLVAAVAGPAVGIGTTLLLHCDLVYAGQSTRFQLPFVNLGLCPEAASSLLLPQRVGHCRAAELLLLGEAFGAERALELGLVTALFPDEELQDRALERARRLAAQPPAAVRLSKALMKYELAPMVQHTLEREGRAFLKRLDSPEAKEAFQAFFERRAPDFSRFD